MIKRNHIRHFLALADAGSFAQAAARLHITQPTLSSGIAELERLVGTRLFLRDRRHVRLTETGGAFLPIARDLERGFRVADSFGAAPAVEWPTLRLGVLRTVANRDLGRIVAALGTHYGIEVIEGTDYDLRAALTGGRIHLALTLLREAEHDLVAHPLWEEAYTMLVPATHPLAGRNHVAPEDLAGEIMIARRSCEILEDTSRFFTGAGCAHALPCVRRATNAVWRWSRRGWASPPPPPRWQLTEPCRWRSMAMRSSAGSACSMIASGRRVAA
jgi:DNA-binding transcriptional LysR family regulator